MIHKFQDFLLEYKQRYSKSEKIEDFADLYIDRVAEKLNVKVIKKLGKGSFGIAYLVDNDKVIKITTDRIEAETAKKLIGKNLKYFLNYYDVFEITLNNLSEDLYFILLDYVRPLTNKEKHIWEESCWSFFNFSHSDKEFLQRIEKYYPENLNYFKSFVKQRKEMFEESNKYYITFQDAHTGNLGIKKDGLIVYFDIEERIIGNKEKIERIDFENDFKKIHDLIVKKYKPETDININDLINDVSKLLNINKVKAWKYIRDEIFYQYNENEQFSSPVLYFKYLDDWSDDIDNDKNNYVIQYTKNYI